jgi:hypothetical protein
MSNNGFAVIERQLEQILTEMKATNDPEQRTKLLLQMRQMLVGDLTRTKPVHYGLLDVG